MCLANTRKTVSFSLATFVRKKDAFLFLVDQIDVLVLFQAFHFKFMITNLAGICIHWAHNLRSLMK